MFTFTVCTYFEPLIKYSSMTFFFVFLFFLSKSLNLKPFFRIFFKKNFIKLYFIRVSKCVPKTNVKNLMGRREYLNLLLLFLDLNLLYLHLILTIELLINNSYKRTQFINNRTAIEQFRFARRELVRGLEVSNTAVNGLVTDGVDGFTTVTAGSS